nr:MAG TPA: hypothetical protein [Caudoviricetes sp.]
MIFDYDPTINFAWYYFIGRTRLGLSSDKEVGRLTLRRFRALYQAYKDTFDIETQLRAKGSTYARLEAQARQEEEWF